MLYNCVKTSLSDTGALHDNVVHLSVCLSVTSNVYAFFLKKLRNLQLWSLLTNNRKSYMGFSKNPFLDL